MDNFLIPSMLDEGHGPELELALDDCSPLLLSPTNELSNPFFSLTTGDLSQTLILDQEMNGQLEFKNRLTPHDLSFGLDYFDKDYFSMQESIKRQRVNQHPTRSSASSLASSASSATPSEADSDLLERGVNDDEGALLKLDNISSYPFDHQQTTLTVHLGLGFHLDYDHMALTDPTGAKSDRRQQQQQQHQLQQHPAVVSTGPASFASVALSTFNLSDFISDQEQEQQQQQQQQLQQQALQQQQASAVEARSNMFVTPDRPLAHRDVSRLMVRSNSYSPASSHFSTTEQRMDESSGLFSDRGPHGHLFNRPGLPMRTYSGNVEALSCNPAHITPSHERRSLEQTSTVDSKQNCHGHNFSSPMIGRDDVAQRLFSRDVSASPHSVQSSPSLSHYNMFHGGEEQHGDVFDGTCSPLVYHEGSRSAMLSYPAPLCRQPPPQQHQPQQQQQQQLAQVLASDNRSGVVRSGRSTSMAASQQSSPYQAPSLEQGSFGGHRIGRQMSMDAQLVPGIITKRSRGRRVPNNPEELNNLGKSGKVYTCKVPGCGKCFKRSEHLKRHVRSIHTDDKPYTCHCGKTFSRHDNLNQHARVHVAEGMDSPESQEASLSPADSPMSLPSTFASARMEFKPDGFNPVRSRLRQASNGQDIFGEEDQVEEDVIVSAMEHEDGRALRY